MQFLSIVVVLIFIMVGCGSDRRNSNDGDSINSSTASPNNDYSATDSIDINFLKTVSKDRNTFIMYGVEEAVYDVTLAATPKVIYTESFTYKNSVSCDKLGINVQSSKPNIYYSNDPKNIAFCAEFYPNSSILETNNYLIIYDR